MYPLLSRSLFLDFLYGVSVSTGPCRNKYKLCQYSQVFHGHQRLVIDKHADLLFQGLCKIIVYRLTLL